MSSSKRSRSRSREAPGKLIRLATADGSLETSAGSSLTLLPRMEESFEEWLKRQKQIGMKMVETLEKTKAMKDKKEIPKPKSPKQSFEECLKRRKHKWTKISSSSSSSASSSQSSRSRSREASGKLIRLATADGSLETSAGSSLTLLPRMEESFEEWLKRQKQIGMKMVETLEKTKVMKDKKEIPKPKSPKQSFGECLKRRKHKSSSSSASSSQSSLRSREARRLAAAKRCANRLKRKQKNDAKKLKDAAERESKENLKRISRIAELEETIRKQEIDTISRIAELEETIRKQEVDAKKLKDAAERESKENLKKNCRIAELEETLRKLQASFKGTLQALEEKRAQLSEENMRLKTDLEMKKHISTFVVSGACWQYEMEGSWHAVPPEGNEQMQKAYLAYLQYLPNSRHATISSGGVARVVDFELMKQRHLATQKVRSIRILPNVPAQWVSTPAELLQQGDDLRSFYKEVADKEILDSIHRILQETGAIQGHPKTKQIHQEFVIFDREQAYPCYVKHLRAAVEAALKDYLGDEADTHELEIEASWANVNPACGLNGPHVHPFSALSGAYYVDCGNNASSLLPCSINLMDPRPSAPMAALPAEVRDALDFGIDWTLSLWPGTVLIFPSWLGHWVPPNAAPRQRMTISFNAGVKEKPS
eukprot:symbB.v1.2.005146.t1/scaffold226.1/size261315/25